MSAVSRLRVGDIVHYMSHGSPVRPDGTQQYESECRAAIVTEVPYIKDTPDALHLCVLSPEGMFFAQGIPHDPYAKVCTSRNQWERRGGTWHFPPERG